MTVWLSIVGNSAGPMNGDGSLKLTLHSTEGYNIEDAVASYRAHNSWATLTVDCKRRRIARHLGFFTSARSLRNEAGGADETNRDGSVHVQVELVGFAEHPETIGSHDDLVWLGAEVVRPIHEQTGVPLVSTVTWLAYPASYGANGVRLSPAAWDAYSGVLGHQHVPDNQHGDPGAIDIQTILNAARGDDDVDDTERKLLADTEARGKETLILVRQLAGADVGDLDVADLEAGGEARPVFKTLVQGALLDGLRPKTDDHPERGNLRPLLVDVVREALVPPVEPTEPAG